MMRLLLAGTLVLLGTYYLFPLRWAPLLRYLDRTRSGLKQRQLIVDGRPFGYLEGGRGGGVPVIMVHGFGGTSDHWVGLARSLVKHVRVLAVDLPGFGRTHASASERFLVPLQAERLRAFLRALGIRRYHLIGNSMGGNISGVLAHDYPDEVRSLTLLEPQGIESRIPSVIDLQIRQGLNPLIPSNKADFDRLVDLAFVRRPFIPRAVYRYLQVQSLDLEPLHRVIWKDLWHPDYPYLLEKNLPGIRAPTLVIWGDSDRFLHETTLDKLKHGLRDMRLVRMAACGHTPMLERPTETSRYVEAFLDDLK